MDHSLRALISWIAPILCFTADEAWLAYTQDETDSIHLHEYAKCDQGWVNEPLAQKWSAIRKVRSAVTTALESARNAGDIGGSLSAAVTIELSAAEHSYLAEQDCASLFITSSATLEIAETDDITVHVRKAEGGKCARCWKIIPTIAHDNEDAICGRCETVVAQQKG